MKVTRRGVLLGALAASSTTLTYRYFPWYVARRSSIEDFLLGLLRVVAVPNPVQVGEAHLLATPHLRQQPRILLDSVFLDLASATTGAAEESATELSAKLTAALREKARRQFEEGDTMRVAHWILARVEVELCALIALDRHPIRDLPSGAASR